MTDEQTPTTPEEARRVLIGASDHLWLTRPYTKTHREPEYIAVMDAIFILDDLRKRL
jgi:hypothetical protein